MHKYKRVSFYHSYKISDENSYFTHEELQFHCTIIFDPEQKIDFSL